MEPWYNVFSYWGLALALLSPWLPFPILAIMILNLLGTFLFLSISHTTPQVGLFLIALHTLPIWFLRKQPIQFKPVFVVFLMYVIVLALQGTDPVKVYKNLLDEPPQTIPEYLKRRAIISA
jgi:predicted benzoate:H+ symporter BenE